MRFKPTGAISGTETVKGEAVPGVVVRLGPSHYCSFIAAGTRGKHVWATHLFPCPLPIVSLFDLGPAFARPFFRKKAAKAGGLASPTDMVETWQTDKTSSKLLVTQKLLNGTIVCVGGGVGERPLRDKAIAGTHRLVTVAMFLSLIKRGYRKQFFSGEKAARRGNVTC